MANTEGTIKTPPQSPAAMFAYAPSSLLRRSDSPSRSHNRTGHYAFTPRANMKLPRAWERKPSTPFAPRTESQKIWKRYALRDLGTNTDIKVAAEGSLGEDVPRAVKRLRPSRQCSAKGSDENINYISTRWDGAVHVTKHKQSRHGSSGILRDPPKAITNAPPNPNLVVAVERSPSILEDKTCEVGLRRKCSKTGPEKALSLLPTDGLDDDSDETNKSSSRSDAEAALESELPTRDISLQMQRRAELEQVTNIYSEERQLASSEVHVTDSRSSVTNSISAKVEEDEPQLDQQAQPLDKCDQGEELSSMPVREHTLLPQPEEEGDHQQVLEMRSDADLVVVHCPSGFEEDDDLANALDIETQTNEGSEQTEHVEQGRVSSPTAEENITLREAVASLVVIQASVAQPANATNLHADDAEYLHDFLTRAKAKKAEAAKIALSPRRPGSPQEIEASLALPSPMTRSRSALVSRDNDSGSYNSMQKQQLKTEMKGVESTLSEATASSPCRRSIRTRLPKPQRAPAGAPSTIPVRRSNGTEFVFLQRTDAQQVALATRSNTKQNKGEAVMPKIKLHTLMSQNQRSPSKSPKKRKGIKAVSWDEQLAYFPTEVDIGVGEQAGAQEEDPKPRATKLRRLGAVNGTPAPKKAMAASAVGPETPRTKGRTKPKA